MTEFNFDFQKAVKEVMLQNTEFISQKIGDAIPKDQESIEFSELVGKLSSAAIIASSEVSTAVLNLYHKELFAYLEENYQKKQA